MSNYVVCPSVVGCQSNPMPGVRVFCNLTCSHSPSLLFIDSDNQLLKSYIEKSTASSNTLWIEAIDNLLKGSSLPKVPTDGITFADDFERCAYLAERIAYPAHLITEDTSGYCNLPSEITITDTANAERILYAGDYVSCEWIARQISCACSEIISNVKVIEYEDRYNDTIASFLRQKNFVIPEPQTHSGTSATGSSAGEIDILIRDIKNQSIICHIEGVRANSITGNWANIVEHITRLFTRYDKLRCGFNFFVVYYYGNTFEKSWRLYQTKISTIDLSNHQTHHTIQNVKTEEFNLPAPPKGAIRTIATSYERDGFISKLVHFFVDVNPL